jgi:hypothetical protein
MMRRTTRARGSLPAMRSARDKRAPLLPARSQKRTYDRSALSNMRPKRSGHSHRVRETIVAEAFPACGQAKHCGRASTVRCRLHPGGARYLVTLLFSSHGGIAGKQRRAKLERSARDALTPGVRSVADPRGLLGSDIDAAQALHRSDEKAMHPKLEGADSCLAMARAFLHAPNGDAKVPTFERGFDTARFVVEFKKPEAS